MSNHFSTKHFGKFRCKLCVCGRDDLFFGLHLLLGEWTSADVMAFFWRKMDICGRDNLFFHIYIFLAFTCFWAEKWTYTDMMTLKEPVLLLRSKNMVTLPKRISSKKIFLNITSNFDIHFEPPPKSAMFFFFVLNQIKQFLFRYLLFIIAPFWLLIQQ